MEWFDVGGVHVLHLLGKVFGEGICFGSLFKLPSGFIVVLLHPAFEMLGGVAYVGFARVGAVDFIHYYSVPADVVVVAFACFVAVAVARFVHEVH